MKRSPFVTPLLTLLLPSSLAAQGVFVHYSLAGDAKHDLYGIAVGAVGDIDGDHNRDFIVGAYEAKLSTGQATVYSGVSGIQRFVFHGDDKGDRFGCSVAGPGDVDGDGVPDFAVGAYQDDDNGTDAGSARVFSGRDGAVLYTFHGKAAGDVFGFACKGAGDVDRDGRADLIVGAPLADGNGVDSGQVLVLSGRDGKVLHTFTGDSPHDWFGYAVNGAGDVDRDGYADLIVGACYDDVNANNSGSATVFSGRTGAVLHRFSGVGSSDWLGVAVAGAGDANRDGYPDLIVGASGADAGGRDTGAAYLFSGRDGTLLHAIAGQVAGDELGVAVDGCGDVDGDGRADVVVGAYRGSTGASGAGSAYVVAGRNGQVLAAYHGTGVDDRFGIAVAGLGDINGDAYPDVVVGAVYDDDNGLDSGSVSVVSSVALTLVADVHTLPVQEGGTMTMSLLGGSKLGNENYWVLGSAAGTAPGTMLNGVRVPLNQDDYMRWTIVAANNGALVKTRGRLDAAGQATAQLVLPPQSDQTLIGTTVHFAWFGYDDKGKIRHASNPVPVTFR